MMVVVNLLFALGLLAVPLANSILSELVVVAAIALVIFLIFLLGGFILKLIFGIIANSILGLLAIFAVNYLFALGIPIGLSGAGFAVLVATAVFGLPAVGTMVILKLLGIALVAA